MSIVNNILLEHSLQLEAWFIENLKHKYDVVKELNPGTNGIAWLTSRGTVLKLTRDSREAAMCKKVYGKGYKHYVDIYSIKKFTRYNSSYFIIDMEYLSPLSPEEGYAFEVAYYLEDYFSPGGFNYKKCKEKGMSREQVLDWLREDYDWAPTIAAWLNEPECRDNAFILKIYDEFAAIKKELKRLNIADLHRGNVGRKKDGRLAAFDLRTG